ncbi:MFS transporter [Methylobacterium trifolii]|uniref:MFS transporter n=1 Tax=Methylobacterium trifolii TaxID=1003092 RepID=A0ABQ4U058_9HYPH|nr:MFS transporter [Methylobacterium trifolii]GJE60252.1 hypothetical protein MPOCJGCO_2363 [Methylobacterium trifolii]
MRDKRLAILAALVMMALATVTIAVAPQFWPVLGASCVLAVIGDMLNPAVAALTLAWFPGTGLTRRLGRNAAFERAGNVGIALLIGGIGWLFPDRAVFLRVPALAVLAAASLFSIPSVALDAGRSRDRDGDVDRSAKAGLRTLLACRPLVVFSLCVMLFHFANGPLLTLVAQEIGAARPEWSSVTVCIVGVQAVMAPMAILVGHRADAWGRNPLLAAAFCALPLRASLYTVWRDPSRLIAVQCLDGVGGGLLSAAKPRGARRPDARHRPLQPRPRDRRYAPGRGRLPGLRRRGPARAGGGLLGGLPRLRRGGARGAGHPRGLHARNAGSSPLTLKPAHGRVQGGPADARRRAGGLR